MKRGVIMKKIKVYFDIKGSICLIELWEDAKVINFKALLTPYVVDSSFDLVDNHEIPDPQLLNIYENIAAGIIMRRK